MILWITLSSVLTLFLFLLTRWIGVSFRGNEAGLAVSVSFSRLRFTVYPRASAGKEVKEEKGEVEGKEKEEQKSKENIRNAIEWLRLASDFARLLKDALNFLRKYGRIAKLNLTGSVGTGDPYLTGTFFGLIETVKGILKQALPTAGIDVQPEFGEKRLDLDGAFSLEIRLIHLVFLLMFTLWNLPKRKVWRLVRNS